MLDLSSDVGQGAGHGAPVEVAVPRLEAGEKADEEKVDEEESECREDEDEDEDGVNGFVEDEEEDKGYVDDDEEDNECETGGECEGGLDGDAVDSLEDVYKA